MIMKIVIRAGLINPNIFVVHPVADDYSDIGAFDKVNLRGEESYNAFKEFLALEKSALEVELEILGLKQQEMALGHEYLPYDDSLSAKIIPKSQTGSRETDRFSDEMELKNLVGIIEHLIKIKTGDKSITIENWIETPPKGGAQERERDRRDRGQGNEDLPPFSKN